MIPATEKLPDIYGGSMPCTVAVLRCPSVSVSTAVAQWNRSAESDSCLYQMEIVLEGVALAVQ